MEIEPRRWISTAEQLPVLFCRTSGVHNTNAIHGEHLIWEIRALLDAYSCLEEGEQEPDAPREAMQATEATVEWHDMS